jgi:hypothetical protein
MRCALLQHRALAPQVNEVEADQGPVRSLRNGFRQQQARVVEPLQPVNEHRAIRIVEDIAPHFDEAVWVDSNQVPIEGRVMEIPECDPVRYGRHAQRIRAWNNMRGLEQLVALEPAHSAMVLVRSDDSLPKLGLL